MFRLKLNNSILILIVFLCVFFISSPSLAKTTEIKDVPTSHWAYKAVQQLVDGGYLGLYEDGTFRGDSPVNRYTLAIVISKVLLQVGEGTASTNPQDVELIRKLSNEFRNELVLLTMENKSLEERLKKIEESKLILAEDQTQNSSNIRMLSSEAKKLQAQISEIAGQILEDKKRLTLLEKQFETHKTIQSQQAEDIKKLRNELEMTREEVKTNRFYLILVGLAGILVGMAI